MTGQPHDDDAEFDAFLQGKGPLAQGLAQLPQPEPSATLDAAILARVAVDLERGNSAVAADGAANDETGPADFQPRRWRERWRLPVALAAGVTAFSIALPLWQEDTAQQQAVNMPSQELQIPAVPEVAPAPVHAADAPAKDRTAAADRNAAGPGAAAAAPPTKSAHAAPATPAVSAAPASGAAHADLKAEATHRDDAMAKRKVGSDDTARKMAERGRMEAPLMEAAPARVKAPPAAAPPAPAPTVRAPASAIAPAPAPAPAQVPVPAPAPKSAPAPLPSAATGMPQEAKAVPSATQPAPVLRFAEEEARQPAAMLARIEQLLNEGKREEARAEWRRLRAAYPDYPVPDTLREALK